jgi:hypothetical protein
VSARPDEHEIEKAIDALGRGEECDLPTEAAEEAEEKRLDRRTSKAGSGDDTLEWITSLLK